MQNITKIKELFEQLNKLINEIPPNWYNKMVPEYEGGQKTGNMINACFLPWDDFKFLIDNQDKLDDFSKQFLEGKYTNKYFKEGSDQKFTEKQKPIVDKMFFNILQNKKPSKTYAAPRQPEAMELEEIPF